MQIMNKKMERKRSIFVYIARSLRNDYRKDFYIFNICLHILTIIQA